MPEDQVKFEDILGLVGDVGRWQAAVLTWSVVGGVLVAMHDLSAVFTAEIPSHHCLLPAGGRAEDWLPIDNATGEFDQCSIRVSRSSNRSVPCSEYTYTWGNGSSSVASEWDLVCSDRWLAPNVQASYYVGLCCGGVLWAVVSDQFGRKRAVVLSVVTFLVVSVSSAFANHYVLYVVLKFLTAALDSGYYSCCFVLCMEITGPRWRAIVGLLYALPYGLGIMLLSAVAYLERDWRRLQLYISLPLLLTLAYLWVLPESPRWLIMQDRLQEALSVLKFAAKRNGRQLPPDDHLLKMMATFRASEVTDAETEARSARTRCGDGVGEVATLLRTPKMRFISIACFSNWLIGGMVIYGVSFGTASLSDDPYLAILLTGVADIPAVLLSIPLIDKLGRRPVVVATQLFTGVTTLLILIVPNGFDWPILLLGTLGKLSCGATFAVMFVYSAEFFPTELRSAGVNLSFVFSRVGSILAPYVVDLLTPLHWAVHGCVFGLCAVVAALATFTLPETVGYDMPETIEDIENGHWERAESARTRQPTDTKE